MQGLCSKEETEKNITESNKNSQSVDHSDDILSTAKQELLGGCVGEDAVV